MEEIQYCLTSNCSVKILIQIFLSPDICAPVLTLAIPVDKTELTLVAISYLIVVDLIKLKIESLKLL